MAGGEPTPQVPDHELIRRIGTGGYGEVWLARNALGTLRAVKVVDRRKFGSDRPFHREFEGLRKYEPVSRSHPGLIQLLQIGRNDASGYFYCVMELADPVDALPGSGFQPSMGGVPASGSTGSPQIGLVGYEPKTLGAILRRQGRLPYGECVEIGLQLTDALAHLHAAGLVHRDIKPANIIFVQGRPKLADVGLVTGIGEPQSMVGTVGFVAPEGPGSPRADIFSLGRLLYEIASGKPGESFPEPLTELADLPERAQLVEWNEVVLHAC